MSDVSLGTRPRYSLVVDEDVKKPTNQPTNQPTNKLTRTLRNQTTNQPTNQHVDEDVKKPTNRNQMTVTDGNPHMHITNRQIPRVMIADGLPYFQANSLAHFQNSCNNDNNNNNNRKSKIRAQHGPDVAVTQTSDIFTES